MRLRKGQHPVVFQPAFDSARAAGVRLSVADVQEHVASHFGLSRDSLFSTSRTARIVRPRQIAMYLAKGMTPRSYPQIARLFGKDHSTVIYSCRQIDALAARDAELYADIDVIASRLVDRG